MFRTMPLPVGLRELGRLFLTTVDLRGRYQPEHPEREGKNGMPVRQILVVVATPEV